MSRLLMIIAALQLCHSPIWAKVDTISSYDLNTINDQYSDLNSIRGNEISDDNSQEKIKNDDSSSVLDENIGILEKLDDERAEIFFRLPLEWVNVDKLKNSVILKFHSPNTNFIENLDPEELKRLQALHQNAFRLGKRGVFSNGGYSYTVPSGNRNEAFLDKNLGMGTERGQLQVVRDSRGDNFMRFGRSVGGGTIGGSSDFMRFGRSAGNNDFMRFGRSAGNNDFMRFGRSAGQDFMRFGRNPGQDFMRFGRSPGQDFMRFGRNPGQDFMRFGRNPGQDFMRFGRNPGQDFMRFGRSTGQDFMRFGRNPGQDFMRFGRSPGQDFMRFGRNPAQDFMRFGRSPAQDFMRFGRNPGQDFMRFGRSPAQDFMRFGRDSSNQLPINNQFSRNSRPDNFMRFGKSPEKSENNTNSLETQQLSKNELKQAVKLIHEADKNAERVDNPVDKAMKVLFDKHQNEELQNVNSDSTQHEDGSDDDDDVEYFLKTLK